MLRSLDYDSDGQPDLFVANDTQPNRLYRNRGNGTFVDVGMTAGVAFNEAGVARAGMGVDAADYDGSGRPSLVIGNFSNEMMALYSNEGNGLFIDEAPASTIGKVSLLTLTFACFFFDYDLDGLLDIFAVNGHVADDISRVQPKVTYAQSPNLFRNRGAKKFDVVTSSVGPDLQKPVVGRGAAYGDYDNDGDADLLDHVQQRACKAVPQRRRQPQSGRFACRRAASPPTVMASGRRVEITLDDGRKPWKVVKTGSSYCSQSELPLTFGLGRSGKVTAIQITWPNGRSETAARDRREPQRDVRRGKGYRPQRATRVAMNGFARSALFFWHSSLSSDRSRRGSRSRMHVSARIAPTTWAWLCSSSTCYDEAVSSFRVRSN